MSLGTNREYITLRALLENSEIDQHEVLLYLLKEIDDLERERSRLRYATQIRFANQEPSRTLFRDEPERIAELEVAIEQGLANLRAKKNKKKKDPNPQSSLPNSKKNKKRVPKEGEESKGKEEKEGCDKADARKKSTHKHRHHKSSSKRKEEIDQAPELWSNLIAGPNTNYNAPLRDGGGASF
jgi:hypothetical protein